MMSHTILVIEDERNMQRVIRMALEDAGYGTISAITGAAALAQLHNHDISVVLTDLKLPDMRGEDIIVSFHKERPDLPIVVLTAFGSIRSAVDCVRVGATDYLTKPFDTEELLLAIDGALRIRSLMVENQRLQAVVSATHPRRRMIGNSPVMQQLRAEIQEVAPYRTNILITGESGVGKEPVARCIHEYSPRADMPWVALNCSAIPRDLMESELFGYVRGAFTGATKNRLGRFEQANGGTLFLDEIGDLDPALQGKLLRVLQEREFSPVGSDTVRKVDVRVLAATHRDLRRRVEERLFREDLYYRLDVYSIHVPPLRERLEDVPMLATTFLTDLRADMNKPVEGFTDAALAAFVSYQWPGNVRELRNAVERALLSCRGTHIDLHDLPDRIEEQQTIRLDSSVAVPSEPNDVGLDAWMQEHERQAIIAALDACNGIQAHAAKQLNITERSLWHRIKKLNIRVERMAKEE